MRVPRPFRIEPGSRRWPLYASAFALTMFVGGGFGLLINMEPGEETTPDHRVASWVLATRPHHPRITEAAKVVTRLGNLEVTATALTVIVLAMIFARWRGSSRIEAEEAPFWLMVAIGGQLMNWGLKFIFRRDRPPSDGRLVPADFYSFPSGHGTFAGVSLMLLAAVMVRAWSEHSRARLAVGIVLTTSLALGVASSRVWLGVHYASDVVVGFLLGLLWAGLCHEIRFGVPRLDASRSAPLP